MTEELKAKLKTLPDKPGCYQMKDKHGKIIYVGKAKNLHNRVNQYFVGAHDYKTTKLVSNIVDFEYVITASDKEAFLLEINLIKDIRPRFNIMLMDDTSYPYLRLTKEEYPTLEVVRDLKKRKDARYFGPYPDVGAARRTYDLLSELFPLRKCKNMPKKVCLYYHLGQCLGPCEKKIEKREYEVMYQKLTEFLGGNNQEVVRMLTQKRNEASDNLKFEEAGHYQELLNSIQYVTSKQQIDFGNKNVDAFGYYFDKGYIAIQGLFLRGGQLIDRTFEIAPIYEEPQEVLEFYLLQYYDKHPLPSEILVPSDISIEALNEIFEDKVRIPLKGNYKKLVDLAITNAKEKLSHQFSIKQDHLLSSEDALEELSMLIGDKPVDVIEMFDNSHISGSDAVAGLVVYRNGQPDKNNYRKYQVHNGNDDLANMKEVIYRRYFRLLMEKKELPDLLIVDGGYNQIMAAKEIIDSLNLSIPILGALKDDKHRTNSLMDVNGELLDIDAQSELFFFITRMQDEVHRFAISYHRQLRSKNQTHSTLEDIPGIGEATRKRLIKKFGSLKNIKEKSYEELCEVVNKNIALNIIDYFKEEN